MCAKQRVAIYGGSFDPVHIGHLEIARKVSALFDIDKVIMVPAQVAPHKVGRSVTAPFHRYAMLALATQDDPKLMISMFELEASDRRFTVDTLSHFVSTIGQHSELFFIMGADSWTEITTWREWQRLLTLVNHIVVTRPGYHVDAPEVVKDRVSDLRSRNTQLELTGQELEGKKIYITDAVMNDVSATKIRSLANEGRFKELEVLVPKPVIEYIKKYGIYQESNEA